jgi:hypothetical protein
MESGFVSFSVASKHLGVPRQRLAALVARGEIEAHRSPLDRRLRLLRVDDLQRLAPRPETPRKEGVAA